MSKQVQIRRGQTFEFDNFTPALGELVVNTDTNQLRLGDGLNEKGFAVGPEMVADIAAVRALDPAGVLHTVQVASTEDLYTKRTDVAGTYTDNGTEILIPTGGDGSIGYVLLTRKYGTGYSDVALNTHSSGASNTALGRDALSSNTSLYNTGIGEYALRDNIGGQKNVAVGPRALVSNTSGSFNIGIGWNAFTSNETGEYNTIIGMSAAQDESGGDKNIAIGYAAGTSISPFQLGSNSNRIVLGDNSITNFYCKVGLTVTSDMRDKQKVQDYGLGLNFINLINPIKYVWDMRSDYMTEDMKTDVNVVKDGTHVKDVINLGVSAQEILEAERLCGVDACDDSLVNSCDSDHLKLQEARLIYPLINAVKELSASNTLLQQQLDDQETRLKKLENAQ